MKKTIGLLLIAFTFSACNVEPLASTGCNTNLVSDRSLEVLLDGPFKKVELEGLPQGTEGCKYISTKTTTTETQSPENEHPDTEPNMNYIMGETQTVEQAKSAYDRAVAVWQTDAMQNRVNQSVPDVGTEAFWSYGESLSQLTTYQDTHFIIVTIAHFKVDQGTALFKAQRMARLLLEDPALPKIW